MRSAVIAVFKNAWVDDSEASLTSAATLSEELGARLAPQIVGALGAPALTYGKGVLLGAEVSEAIGAAMIHARLGKPMRAAVGGGAAVIPSNIKRATFNTQIDVPLGHKDDPWAFELADTLPIALHDGPAADEFVLCMAVGGEVEPSDPLDIAFPGAS